MRLSVPLPQVTTVAIYMLVALTLWSPVGGSVLGGFGEPLRYAFILAVAAFLCIYAYRTSDFRISLSGDWVFLACFLIYVALSAFWSEGGANAYIKGLLVFSAMLTALSISHLRPMDEIVVIFYRGMCVFIVMSLLTVLFLPDIGIERGWEVEGDWRGLAGQKNGLGHLAALGLVGSLGLPLGAAAGRGLRPLLLRLAMVAINAVVLVNSGSRGALVSAGVGVGALLLARMPRALQRLLLLVFVALAVPLVNVILPTIELNGDKIDVLGTTLNTSNRTTIWFYGLEQLGDRPLFGFGLSGFWTPERMLVFKDTYGWVLDNFHNGYITILIEGGLVGLMLLAAAIAFLMMLYLIAIGNLRDRAVAATFAYTCMFLFGNLVENSIGRSTATTFIMFITLAFALRPYLVSRVRLGGKVPAGRPLSPALS